MAKLKTVSVQPKIAVQYILDPKKLESTPGLKEFFKKTQKTIRSLQWELKEFGPDINPDVISSHALDCSGQFAGFLGVTFTGTSARQTAVIGRFNGPVGVWYFPSTTWWSMASAGSGIGYLRDEEEDNPNLRLAVIWGNPEEKEALKQLECFARASHALFAMKREKIGLIGGSYYDVMPASNWHPDTLTARLGPSYVEIDISLLVRAQKEVKDREVEELLASLKSKGMRLSKDEKSINAIKMSARTSLAIEKLQKQYGLTGAAINCYGGPDPNGYTGVMGYCGASGCLKGHALNSIIIGCESDVIQTAQQMLFRHLIGVVPCMADPWKVDSESGTLLAGTCSGPAELAGNFKNVTIEQGTLMSLYKVGELGVCFPQIKPADAIVARIAGRRLDKMVLATGKFIGSDSTTIPGRLCLKVALNTPEEFLSEGVIGNHYTFLPTDNLEADISRIEMCCNWLGIEVFDY